MAHVKHIMLVDVVANENKKSDSYGFPYVRDRCFFYCDDNKETATTNLYPPCVV